MQGPDPEAPDRHGAGTRWSVAGLLGGMAARGTAPAIVTVADGGTSTLSFAETAETALRLTAGLRDSGAARDAPVAFYAPNSPAWIAAALGVAAAGAMIVTIDDVASEEDAHAILSDSGARLVLTTRAHAESVGRAPEADARAVYLFDAEEGEESWRRLLAETSAEPEAIPPDSPACLFYTSGTTGRPKGFVLTHGNIGTNVTALAGYRLLGPGDRALLPLPLHHAYPFIVGMLTTLESGVAVVLPESVTGPHVVAALRAADATAVFGVPRLFAALVAGVEGRIRDAGGVARRVLGAAFALSVAERRRFRLGIGRWLMAPVRARLGPRVRLLVSGGAPLDPALALRLKALGWEVLEGYGLAETASVFTCTLPWMNRPGSVGKPLDGGAIRIADPDEEGIGEIQMRGPNVTPGYWNNPEADAESFTGDGWFRTGDMGRLDGEGFLYVTGRAKELIVLGGGKKVVPETLEKAYVAHPFIGEVAVLERDGQLVGLVRPDAQELARAGTMNAAFAVRVALGEVGQSLPRHERLAGFAIALEPLPQTRLGKYRRFLLPRLYEDALAGVRRAEAPELSDEDRRLLADPVAGKAWALIADRYADKGPGPDSHLALDLGIDSLGWMTLALDLEARTGVTLAGQDTAGIETVRDLIEALRRAGAQTPGSEEPAGGWQARLMADRARWTRLPRPAAAAAGHALWALDRAAMRLVFRLRAEGREGLPRTGRCVLVCNHVSDLDPPALAAALPFAVWRRTFWAGDVTRVFRGGIRRLLGRTVRLYPVDERAPASAIEMGAAVLDAGHALVWFPEGWRSPDGRLQPFLPGIGRLLAGRDATVVPVRIAGTFEAMPRSRRWPRPHPLRVVFGEPVDVATLAGEGTGTTPEERIADALHARVGALAGGDGPDAAG